VLAVALLVGSAAAFTRTERLKLAASPVSKPQFERYLSPACDCPHSDVQLSLLLRRPETLDVSVVDADGAHVTTLVEGEDARAGRQVFTWDGRSEDGQVVPDGLYRLKVRLEHDRRTILIPKTIHVDSTPPHARVLDVVRTGGGLVLRYRSNEAGHAVLVENGRPVERGRRRGPGTWRLDWGGPVTTSASGLALVVVDLAGNRSRPAPVDITSS